MKKKKSPEEKLKANGHVSSEGGKVTVRKDSKIDLFLRHHPYNADNPDREVLVPPMFAEVKTQPEEEKQLEWHREIRRKYILSLYGIEIPKQDNGQ